MTYSLWHTLSRNLIDSYPSEAAALKVVREAVARHGEQYVDQLSLTCESARGTRVTLIAAGPDLLARAQSSGLIEPLSA